MPGHLLRAAGIFGALAFTKETVMFASAQRGGSADLTLSLLKHHQTWTGFPQENTALGIRQNSFLSGSQPTYMPPAELQDAHSLYFSAKLSTGSLRPPFWLYFQIYISSLSWIYKQALGLVVACSFSQSRGEHCGGMDSFILSTGTALLHARFLVGERNKTGS